MKLFKKQIDPNLLIAVGVLIASFSALFVYIRQASIMREQTEILLQQTKANSWPYLDLSYSYNSSGKNNPNKKYSLSVVNKGTGPAIIQNISISYDGILVKNWKELHAALNIPDSILEIGYNKSSISNKVISPNESIKFINWSGNNELINIARKNAGKITVRICYKSVFNEFWNLERIGFDGIIKQVTYSEPESCLSNNDAFED